MAFSLTLTPEEVAAVVARLQESVATVEGDFQNDYYLPSLRSALSKLQWAGHGGVLLSDQEAVDVFASMQGSTDETVQAVAHRLELAGAQELDMYPGGGDDPKRPYRGDPHEAVQWRPPVPIVPDEPDDR